MYDWVIVGAGFTGSTLAERIASQLDQKVLVIDRRGHIAGNAYDYAGDFSKFLFTNSGHTSSTPTAKKSGTTFRILRHGAPTTTTL